MSILAKVGKTLMLLTSIEVSAFYDPVCLTIVGSYYDHKLFIRR